MAQLITTSSRIKIWRHDNLPTTPMDIDPDGPKAGGVFVGYLTKRILIKAATGNNGNVRVWDQSQSPQMYYELDADDPPMELWVDSSLLVKLSGSASNQGVCVYMELQTGAT